MRRADRLIKIVHYLRRMRHAVTAQKIADDFDICQRTVYRDIQDLMNSGVPIYGEAGVGYVIDKKYHLPPVMFDADELEAIALGINMVCNWTDEKFSGKARSALEKIQAVLSDSLLRDMEQLTTYSEESHRKIPWEADFSEIRECIRNRRKISFQYRDLKNKVSQRTIRPLSMGFFGPVWLVTGWCESRRDFRNFRLDRIRNFASTEEYFKDEKGKTLKAYLAQTL
ncbi:MAG: YafY family protein [Proteobacteria bacterium]|nr:YafY family protein [Pseudomonadota bacterium]MDA0928519.1 YafY family protein [Pseudomonadota bacterium]